MFNPFIIKKYAALLFNSFGAVIMFYIGLLSYGFLGGLGFMAVSLILGVLVGNLLLKNPFTEMLEGKGILTLPVDSSGLINPFILKVKMPFVEGKYRGEEVSDVFNRNTVFNIAPPRILHQQPDIETDKEGNKSISIKISEEEFNIGRFQLNQYPCFIYNLTLNSIITKEMLATSENKAFAEHTILNLTRKVNELSKWIRDFARYAIEQMKPKKPFNLGGAAMWVIIVFLVIMLIIFMPSIINIVGGTASGATSSAVSNALNSAKTIIPK